jgi:2-dehydropantoate 2-reductase
MPPPSIAIVGSGAVGCFYGARLVRGGADVRFLLRRDYARVAADGLTVRQVPAPDIAGSDRERSFHLPSTAFRACRSVSEVAARGAPDWIWLAVKTTAVAAVMDDLAAIAGPRTRIAALCNGLGVEDALAARFGAERIFGVLCFVCINRQADGSIDHLGHGQLGLGSLAGGPCDDLAALCDLGGIQRTIYPSLTEARWRKLVWNIPFNGLCTVNDCTTDAILADPRLAADARALMVETIAAANADLAERRDPARIGEDWIDEQFRRTREMGPYAPSTLLDRRAGAIMELDALFREPLRRAHRHGVATPVLAQVVAALDRLAGASR